MDKLRLYGISTIAAMVITGVLAVVAANEGWLLMTVALIFLAFLISTCMMLLSLRHFKWTALSAERRSRAENKKIMTQIQKILKGIESVSALNSEINKIKDSQEDGLVVLDAKIGNLETRVQRMLDLSAMTSDSEEASISNH